MNGWQRWVKAPQTLWFRRALFQIHLWLGIGVGLYVVMISVTGSAVVFRTQISRWFITSDVPSTAGVELKGAELDARIAEVYQSYEIVMTVPSSRQGRATYVMLKENGEEVPRFFDQFTGQDLGPSYPWQVSSIEWLTNLHDNLLAGRQGRKINGWGGVMFLVMVISGLVLWWQGSRRWKDGLLIKRESPRGFNWQLHNFIGFWSLLLMFAWGVTAIYFAWSEPFDLFIDWIDDDIYDPDRPDGFLRFLIDLHFGRFRGLMWANILWIFLGLLPAVMFITGFILWYKRVLRRYL